MVLITGVESHGDGTRSRLRRSAFSGGMRDLGDLVSDGNVRPDDNVVDKGEEFGSGLPV